MIIKYNEFNNHQDKNIMFNVDLFLKWYKEKYDKELERNDIKPEIVSEWFEENDISNYELIQDIDRMVDLLRVYVYKN